jgi:hypothetical protein
VSFIQIIEFRTSDIEAVRQVDEEWRRATEGKRTARREVLTRDHSDPSRYFAIVYFDSFESAMENSARPETNAVSERYMQVTDGEPKFYDLEVIGDAA